MARKKWKIRNPNGTAQFPSEARAYQAVAASRKAYKSGSPNAASTLRVFVDEGNGAGWELFERINFKEEG